MRKIGRAAEGDGDLIRREEKRREEKGGKEEKSLALTRGSGSGRGRGLQ